MPDPWGFESGSPAVPVPHSHHFHAEYDSVEQELLEYMEWHHFSLQPGDEY